MQRVKTTAIAFSLVLIVAFQLQLFSFVTPWFVSNKTIWPIVYYSFWALIIAASGASLLLPGVLRRSLPVIIVGSALMALALFYPIGVIAKNSFVSMTFLICVTVLAIASGPVLALRFAAVATAVSACICLIDILFARGLTDTAGRAAGLSTNPNIAALGLLLGASVSYRVVPFRLAGHFIVLVLAAIFATLSKSTLIAYLIIFGGIAAYAFRHPPRPRILGPTLFALALCAWLWLASSTNDRFRVATSLAFSGLRNAVTAFETAKTAVSGAVAIRERPAPSSNRAPGPPSTNVARPPSTDAAEMPRSKSQVRIEELGHRAAKEGDINSISARGLLMERAWLAYHNGPIFGVGLDAAYTIESHNSFLFFALAFGPIGWLVPLLFIGLTLRRSIIGAPMPLAIFIAAMVSHDVFRVPGLLAPIALGIAYARISDQSQNPMLSPEILTLDGNAVEEPTTVDRINSEGRP